MKINEEKLFQGITGVDTALIEESDSPMEPGRIIHPRFKKLIAAAVAAVLVIALSVTAAAAGLLTEALNAFTAMFGGEPGQVELIEKMGSPIGVSVTQEEITVSADAVMSDGENYMVLFTVSRNDGSPLVPADAAPDGQLRFGASGWDNDTVCHGISLNRFIDGEPGALTAHYLGYFVGLDGSPNEVSGWFSSSLEYWVDSSDGYTEVLELCDELTCWEMDIPLTACETVGVTIPAAGTFSKDGFEFAVKEVRASPLAVAVDCETVGARASKQPEEFDCWSVICCGTSLILRLKDGRELDLSTYDDSLGNGLMQVMPSAQIQVNDESDEYLYRAGRALPEIIPVEDMACVVLNGLEIPLE